ncbi:MAG TPA: class I SAM-dependent methyltransferase [Kofleriaceae bacterium]|nr:class I SAM-dependent methyltransferase [Kofleriaceae bacterium]
MTRVYRDEPLTTILGELEAQLAAGAGALAICVLDPDLGRGCHAGALIDHAGARFVHRPFRVWVDLAERLGLRLQTPRPADAPGLITLRFEPLEAAPRAPRGAPAERYGHGSAFARIAKLEDPGFVVDLTEAVTRAGLGAAPRVLDLGVNTGDELTVIQRVAPACDVVGIDHSASALAIARDRFPGFRFIEADLGALATLGLGVFDLVISLNTLQSPGVDDRAVLRQVVQHHLAPGGAVILGLPNSRYVDGEIVYGARMKNFRQPELGLLVKDVAFYRKYLQQHHRQVFVTGKHYVLVTGVAESVP